MKLIAFVGKKRSGKDTSCDYLSEKYGFSSTSFAGPLKEGCKHWFGFTEEQLTTDQKEDIDPYWGISPRKVYQTLGVEVVREQFSSLFGKEFGVNFWIMRMEKTVQDGDYTVISDARFQNEVDWVKKRGGYVVKILRETKYTDSHCSENIEDIENIDEIIYNNGTVEELYEKLDIMIKRLVD